MPNITKDEPVLVVSAVGAAVSYVGSALVAHGVVGADVMTSAEQTVVPIVASGVVLLLGVIVRHLVAPYAKVKRVLERENLLTDADFARFEALVSDVSGQPIVAADAPLQVDVVPDGMVAGSPTGVMDSIRAKAAAMDADMRAKAAAISADLHAQATQPTTPTAAAGQPTPAS